MESNFKNDLILPSQFPAYEEVTLTKVDPKYWNVIAINLLIIGIILTGILACLYIYSRIPILYLHIATSLSALIYLSCWILYKKSFTNRGYALREKDIIYKSGVLIEKTEVIPLNRVQHIGIEEGVFPRMFQLASLHIFNASTHGSPLIINGLPKEIAFQLKTEILSQNLSTLPLAE